VTINVDARRRSGRSVFFLALLVALVASLGTSRPASAVTWEVTCTSPWARTYWLGGNEFLWRGYLIANMKKRTARWVWDAVNKRGYKPGIRRTWISYRGKIVGKEQRRGLVRYTPLVVYDSIDTGKYYAGTELTLRFGKRELSWKSNRGKCYRFGGQRFSDDFKLRVRRIPR